MGRGYLGKGGFAGMMRVGLSWGGVPNIHRFPVHSFHRNRNRKPQEDRKVNRKDGFAVFAVSFCRGCGFICGFGFSSFGPQPQPQPHLVF